jgi:2-dehydro-3-deoxygluconokinase
MTKFLTFGETLVQHNADYIGPYDPGGSYTRHVAGAESNVALDLRRLMPDIEAVWVSRLGQDTDGDMILDQLRGGITVHAPQFHGEFTGIQLLNHLSGGEVLRRYRRAGSAASRLTSDEVLPHLDSSDLVHVTGITPALSDTCRCTVLDVMRSAAERGIPVSMDVNYRDALWTPAEAKAVCDEMRRLATLFKVGQDEAETIWGLGHSAEDYARFFHDGNTGLTVITTGDSGAVAYDGGQVITHPGFTVEIVDPVGAGDAFVAGFLAGIFTSCDIPALFDMNLNARANILSRALEIANACGALVCTQHGDTEPMQDMTQVEEFVTHPAAVSAPMCP